ncbi:MAG: NAD(P)H-hydrate epimerase [Solirubrobacteraceae bacterium]
MSAAAAKEGGPAFPSVEADAVPWITVAQMREIDRIAIELGVTLPRMMENAGAHLALVALALLGGDVTARRIAILAGRGGNGGGGLVAARRLIGWGAEVGVHVSDEPDMLAPVPREQLEILRATGANITIGADRLEAPDLVIDGILGYSQRGDPRGGAAELIAAAAGARVLSLDVPSGLALEDGAAGEPAITAEATLTLALPKAGLRADAASRLTGSIYLADIGIPAFVFERSGIRYRSPFSRGPVVRLVGR